MRKLVHASKHSQSSTMSLGMIIIANTAQENMRQKSTDIIHTNALFFLLPINILIALSEAAAHRQRTQKQNLDLTVV